MHQIFHDVKVKEIVDALERFAPLPLQDDYDNAGLQIGLTEAEVSGALLCLDVTEQVVREAVERRCSMIVSHHPLLFKPLRHIGDATTAERAAALAVKNDIAVYAAHTNLDNARGGVNYEIARRLGVEHLSFLRTQDGQSGSGVVGELAEAEAADDFLRRLKKTFAVDCLMANECLKRPVRKVAICGGAGDFLLDDAVRQGADAFVTGEMHYHVYFGYEQKIQIAVLGHYQSEQFTICLLRDVLRQALPGLRTEVTAQNTNPIRYW